MIKLNINHTRITASNLVPLVEGNVQSIFVKFVFSSEWNGLSRIAVFKNGQTKVSVSLASDECAIPWEVLNSPSEVFVSVRGLGNSGNFVLCTGNETLGKVAESDAKTTAVSADDATPEVLDTLLADVAELKSDIEDLETDVEELESSGGASGADGKSAYELAVEEGYIGTLAQWLSSLKGETGATGPQGPSGADGEDGSNGKSAYELAVEYGFTGNEQQWLASLKGETGATGANGAKGTDGKSAYEIAVEHGFVGNEQQWLASLKGATGATGADGEKPEKGTDYWTAEDKAEIVSDVLNTLPTWTGGSY